MIKNTMLILAATALVACSNRPPLIQQEGVNFTPKKLTQVYPANYDYTWRMALKEMQTFPIKIANKDGGSIITETISTQSDRYETTSAIMHFDPRHDIKYYMDLRISSLPPNNDIPLTEVSITKYIIKIDQLGFQRPVKSDLLDEQVVLHRIKTLLEIERLKLERNRK